MTKRKADTRGGYVHPQPPYIDPKGGVYPSKQKGITLRDELAKDAMKGLIAADTDFTMSPAIIAKQSYIQADEMLKARNA
jgi:hypothetical protein